MKRRSLHILAGVGALLGGAVAQADTTLSPSGTSIPHGPGVAPSVELRSRALTVTGYRSSTDQIITDTKVTYSYATTTTQTGPAVFVVDHWAFPYHQTVTFQRGALPLIVESQFDSPAGSLISSPAGQTQPPFSWTDQAVDAWQSHEDSLNPAATTFSGRLVADRTGFDALIANTIPAAGLALNYLALSGATVTGATAQQAIMDAYARLPAFFRLNGQEVGLRPDEITMSVIPGAVTSAKNALMTQGRQILFADYDYTPFDDGESPVAYLDSSGSFSATAQKIQYRFKRGANSPSTLVWAEVFTPKDPALPKSYDILSWQSTGGATESPTYTLDPLGLDPADAKSATRHPNQDGSYQILLLDADLAVDANRNGKIKFRSQDSSDLTSATAPFRFWVNDDDDTEYELLAEFHGKSTVPSTKKRVKNSEQAPALQPDYRQREMVSPRNLEDFARLWLNVAGLTELLASDQLRIGLRWKAGYEGAPALNLYLSADPSGSDTYLTDETGNAAQVQISKPFGRAIVDQSGRAGVAAGSTFVFSPGFWNGMSDVKPTKCLLFEGAGEGAGELAWVLIDPAGHEVAEGPGVWFQFLGIKSMYQQFRATPATLPRPFDSAVGPYDATQVGFEPYPGRPTFRPQANEEQTVLVFVNGSNERYAYSTSVAETVFKRLWWQGYNGRLVSFRWETLVGPFEGALPAHYNLNEWLAWMWGKGLRDFLASSEVPAGYTTNVAAHSLGTTVVASALQLGMKTSNVLCLQGAIPAGCFDPSGGFNDPSSVNGYGKMKTSEELVLTPDFSSELGYRGFVTNSEGATIYNFFNTDDYALATGPLGAWEGNQEINKPDPLSLLTSLVLNARYLYNSSMSLPVGQRGRLIAIGGGLTRFVSSPYESMAFLARSRSKALGAFGQVRGIVSFNINVGSRSETNLQGERPDHSGEFTRSAQKVQFLYNTIFNLVK